MERAGGGGEVTQESTETNEATQTQTKEAKNQQTPNSSTQGCTDGRTHEQAQSNMPLQLFQSWGHNKSR